MLNSVPTDCNKWVERYKDDFGFVPTSVALRTKTAPGTTDRIEVLRQRIVAGQPLFVRGDVTLSPQCTKYAEDMSGTVWKGSEREGRELSRCGRYQYRSWVRWDMNPNKPYAAFIGLSPSDAQKSSMRAARKMALTWGCGGFEMVNLFGVITGPSSKMLSVPDPIGDHNDRAIRLVTESASFTVCCWGVGGSHLDRSARVLWAVRKRIDSERLLCFGLTEKRESWLTPGKLVGQPVTLSKLQRGAVTIPVPFGEVDYNDDVVLDIEPTDEEFFDG